MHGSRCHRIQLCAVLSSLITAGASCGSHLGVDGFDSSVVASLRHKAGVSVDAPDSCVKPKSWQHCDRGQQGTHDTITAFPGVAQSTVHIVGSSEYSA
ncbi:TPA: hypothetical protein ACH3X3_011741 [Trebouxia sp. C0006]